jgi:O-antigen/teichoic acid export membrane protein
MTRHIDGNRSSGFTHGLRTAALSRTVRAAAHRITWGIADQGVSSITNFAVGIVVARSLGAVEFGAFSLAWVTYSVVINLSRGLATDPLAVRFSGVAVDRWRDAASRSTSTALMVGLATGVASLAAGLAIGGTVGAAFVGLGLVLPALMLQDSWRFAFFAAGEGRRAFTNDLVWAVTLVPALFLAAQAGSVFSFMLAWGAAGAVAAVFGIVQTRLVPRVSGIPGWISRHRDLGMRYMVENVSISSAAQLRMYGLGAIAGLADVGSVRGAQLLLGPFLAVLMGMSLVSVPEAARVLARSPRRLPHFCLLLGGSQATAAMLWGVALLFLLPAAAGQYLLGSVWPTAATLIVPTTLVVMAGSFTDGAMAGLRALGAARRSLRAQTLSAIAYVAGGLMGAAVDGALGSAWGVVAATAFGATMAWWQLRAGLRDRTTATSEPTAAHIDHEEASPR